MSDIFVERKPDGNYVARQNHRIIATGSTQELTADRAHRLKPNDPVFVERVRDTKGGSRDKWRRVY
jgi:hypothetical protein